MRLRILTLLILGFSLVGITSCEPFRDLITKHNINLGGAMHGKKLYKGAKNCTACHGINLDGNGPIPSCYSCHDAALWEKTDHVVDRAGTMHRVNVFSAAQTCKPCHGDSYQGRGDQTQAHGGIPSCYDCHVSDVWTALSDHTTLVAGKYHGTTNLWDPDGTTPAYGTGAAPYCSSCHGSDLNRTGATSNYAPSCYSCHNERWQLRSHLKTRGNYKHEAGMYDPLDSVSLDNAAGTGNLTGCNSAACHGATLAGQGTAPSDIPSCTSCHGNYWVKTPHTRNKDGYNHGQNADSPTEYCSACHQSDAANTYWPNKTTGRAAAYGTAVGPMCSNCHGKKWDGI